MTRTCARHLAMGILLGFLPSCLEGAPHLHSPGDGGSGAKGGGRQTGAGNSPGGGGGGSGGGGQGGTIGGQGGGAGGALGNPNGSACSDPSECSSGYCVENLCCDEPCDGGCVACALSVTGVPDGTCAPVPRGDDPASACTEEGYGCDGQGTCEVKAWDTTPVLLEGDNGNSASGPRIALTAEGDGMVVWAHGTPYEPWFNRLTRSWQGDAPVPHTDDDIGAQQLQVAVNQDGQAIVAWINTGTENKEIWAAFYDPRSGFSDGVPVGTGRWSDPIFVHLDDGGHATVMWQNKLVSGGAELWWSERTPQGVWSEQTRLMNNANPVVGTGGLNWYAMAGNSAGDVVVVWEELVAPNYQIKAVRRTPPYNWGAVNSLDYNLARTSSLNDGVRVAMRPDGTSAVVWNAYKDTGLRLWISQYKSYWSSAVEVPNDYTTMGPIAPQLAVSHDGALAVIWCDQRTTGPASVALDVWVNLLEGDDWNTYELQHSNGACSSNGKSHWVGFDGFGRVLAVWAASSTWWASERRNGVWSEKLDLGIGHPQAEFAISASGDAWLVWNESFSGAMSIRALGYH